jgi:CHAT domain-containing protein/tetratricopeptide (TPR) repeat protein
MRQRMRRNQQTRFVIFILSVFMLALFVNNIRGIAQAPTQTDEEAEAQTFLAEGSNALREKKDLKKAKELLEKALAIYRRHDNSQGQASAYMFLGYVAAQQDDKPKMFENFSQVIPLWHKLNMLDREAQALELRGIAATGLERWDDAFNSYDRAQTIYVALNARPKAGGALVLTAKMFEQKGDKRKAAEYYTRATSMLRGTSDKAYLAKCLGTLAHLQESLGDGRKARENYEEAVQLARELQDQTTEAIVLLRAGKLNIDEDELKKASEELERVLEIGRNLQEPSYISRALLGIGYIQRMTRDFKRAIDSYNQSLLLIKGLELKVDGPDSLADQKANEANALKGLGMAYDELGKRREALNAFIEALKIRRELSDPHNEAEMLIRVGKAHGRLGETETALQRLQEAIIFCRERGEKVYEIQATNNIGLVYSQKGEPRKALETYQRALALSQTAADLSEEVTVLNNIGKVYDDLGDVSIALEYFEGLLLKVQTLRKIPGVPTREEGLVHANLGYVLLHQGRVQEAVKHLDTALTIIQAKGTQELEAFTLNNLGLAKIESGEIQRGIEDINKAMQIWEGMGERQMQALALSNLGAVFGKMGDTQACFKYYEQAYVIFRDIDHRRGMAYVRNNSAGAIAQLGDSDLALDLLNKTLADLEEVGDLNLKAHVLFNLAGVTDMRGDVEKALQEYDESLELGRKTQDRALQARVLRAIGITRSVHGESEKALACFKEALSLVDAAGALSDKADVLGALGAHQERAGEFTAALDTYLQSLAIEERVRSSVSIEEFKVWLSHGSADTYRRAILLSQHAGKSEGAFELSERARARVFLDQLGNMRLNPRKSAQPKLTEEEQRLGLEITTLEQKLSEENLKTLPERSQEIIRSLTARRMDKHKDYENLLIMLKLSDPRYASLRTVQTFDVKAAQKLLAKDTTLVSYYVTPNETLAFVITADSFHTVALHVKEAELISTVKWFREFADIGEPSGLVTERLSNQLYGWLIAPLQQYLTTPLVGVVPHGILHYLPFAALANGQKSLIDEHALFYLPSVSTLQYLSRKQKSAGQRLLAIAQSRAEGHSPLPYADEEAQSIAKMYGSQALVGGEATKAAFVKRVGDYNILHLAAHGELNKEHPLFSHIILGRGQVEDSFLEVRQIYELDLSKSDLVVLSACQTQLGAVNSGDEVTGLNRAFIYSGAPTVVASLWNVSDRATSYLMTRFYLHYKQGLGKAEALRAAQRETREKFKHPYYWAPFVLSGAP